MEITILVLVWLTSLFFIGLSFFTGKNQNNTIFLLFGAIGLLACAYSLGEVSYIVPNSVGMTWVDVSLGNSHTVGLVGIHYWLWGIGIAIILLVGALMLTNKKVGDEV